MTTLTQDTRVIADSAVETVFDDGTAYIHGIVRGEEGKDFWVYPLKPEVVERLAQVEYRHVMQFMYGDSPYGIENYEIPKWDVIGDAIQDVYRDRIRAIFAELMRQP